MNILTFLIIEKLFSLMNMFLTTPPFYLLENIGMVLDILVQYVRRQEDCTFLMI